MDNKTYMEEREYACFLREVADQVEALLDRPSHKKTYKQRLRQFKRKIDKVDRTFEKYVENAQKNAKLRDKEGGPPKKDWVWEKTWIDGSGYWRPPVDEDTIDLRDALSTEWLTTIIPLSETQRQMSDGERLLCDYALLAAIHDVQPAVTGSPVTEGVWDDTPEWAQEVSFDWGRWIQHVEYYQGHGNRTRLLRALKRVEADLDSVAKCESQGQREEDSRAHASAPDDELGGEDAAHESEELGSLSDESTLSPRKLAEVFGVSQDALRKRLERLRDEDHRCFIEVADRTPKEPQFLYYLGKIRHVIEDMKGKAASSETSSKRPARKKTP